MRGSFAPQLNILPPSQRRLWDELGQTPKGFVLYGGTAIALRLAHRTSEDFDFFSSDRFLPTGLLRRVGYLQGAEVVQESENTLTCLVDREEPVRVSFFGGIDLQRVGEPETAPGPEILVASLLDLAGMKAAVVLQRAALKDYVDIDALLQKGITLPRALAAAAVIYGRQFNPVLALKALSFFEEGDVKLLSKESRERLIQAVRSVDPAGLPSLEGRPGVV